MKTLKTFVAAAFLAAVIPLAGCGGSPVGPTVPDAPAPRVEFTISVAPEIPARGELQVFGGGFPPKELGTMYVVWSPGKAPTIAKTFLFPEYDFSSGGRTFIVARRESGDAPYEYEMWLFAPSIGESNHVKVRVIP